MRLAPTLYLLVYLHHDRHISVVVHEGYIEEVLTEPGFKALELLLSRGSNPIWKAVPVTMWF